MVRPFALLALVACASAPNLPLRHDPAPPAGSTTEVFTARDGTQLLARHWATAEAPKAVVVIMHGLRDYSARYAELATELTAHGYAVYAFDLRGHGRPAGPRVAPDDWFDYVDDLDRFLTLVEQREPGKRVFLFGHSMGGEIAGLAAERHRPQLAGLILSGAALEVKATPLLIAATRLAAFLLPKAPGLAFDNRDFSSDPKSGPAMDADPLISSATGPASTAAGLLDGMHQFWDGIDALTMPLLVLHGTADRLTAPAGSRMLVETAPAQDKTLKIYPALFHDLVHEPQGARVRADILAWLDAHTGGAALPATPIYDGDLVGDPHGWAEAVAIAAGVGKPGNHLPGETFSGRLAVDLAIPRPVGWSGSFTARTINGDKSIALRPLGVAFHLFGTTLGASVGGSIVGGGLVGSAHLALAGGFWFEQPAGPLHLSLFGDIDRIQGFDPVFDLGLSLRLGGDRHYWPHARAGVGPVVTAGLSADSLVGGGFVLVGLQLYGAD